MNERRQKAYHPDNVDRNPTELIEAACTEMLALTKRHFEHKRMVVTATIPARGTDSDVLIMDGLRAGADLYDALVNAHEMVEEMLRTDDAGLLMQLEANLRAALHLPPED